MKRSRINPISKKKSNEIRHEQYVRKKLMARSNGLCEECGCPPDWRGLHPHEEVFRSHGGKMSEENSKMLCGRCHNKKHGIKEI